ncbi:MAG: class I SAM-dependent methyltransferase [Deltaproteobacteria bacterium]|jgi:SAM-dependent methyltransferase|nr:class I SAM-dependent methyltransferase [Deltaproteobacteria bacterium]
MFSRIINSFRDRHRRKKLYATEDYWNSKADCYGTGSGSSMWPNTVLNEYYTLEQESAIASLGLSFNGSNVLDLGCGTGRFSRRFASEGADVIGLDFSEKALDIAKSLSSDGNPHYIRESIFKLDWPARFDLIFATATLAIACRNEHELKDILTRVGKALKTDGVLLVIEPLHRGLLSRVLDMNLKDFLRCLSETGLVSVNVKPLAFWPIRIVLAYIPLPRFLTAAIYRLGTLLMRLPPFTGLGDYWAVEAKIAPGGPLDFHAFTEEETPNSPNAEPDIPLHDIGTGN